jgi:hypothetical protein
MNETENIQFYWQMGEAYTTTMWKAPSYHGIYDFFSNVEVQEVLNKYKDSEMIGNCLWDINKTRDLDLMLILPINNDIGDIFSYDWESIEDDVNKLNHIALNQFNILLDVAVTPYHFTLPNKEELSLLFDPIEGKYRQHIKDEWVSKISYLKKIINGQTQINDQREVVGFEYLQLTNRYMIAYRRNHMNPKISDKILRNKKENINNAISVNDFLDMSEEEFTKFQNY